MAFLSVPSKIKTSILGFIKHIVPKKYYKAIDMVLSPCCSLAIESLQVECATTPGKYNVTVKFVGQPNLLGIGFATINLRGNGLFGNCDISIPYDDSGTVTFTDLPATVGTYLASFNLVLPTTSSNISSPTSTVVAQIVTTTITIPVC